PSRTATGPRPGLSQAPPPNPIAAEPDGRRVLSRGGAADHEVTPQAPLTGSGCREYSYGGFGGGRVSIALIQRLSHAGRLLPPLAALPSGRCCRGCGLPRILGGYASAGAKDAALDPLIVSCSSMGP